MHGPPQKHTAWIWETRNCQKQAHTQKANIPLIYRRSAAFQIHKSGVGSIQKILNKPFNFLRCSFYALDIFSVQISRANEQERCDQTSCYACHEICENWKCRYSYRKFPQYCVRLVCACTLIDNKIFSNRTHVKKRTTTKVVFNFASLML